jgi:ribosomal protein S18 acetylase RimI-like enzyme
MEHRMHIRDALSEDAPDLARLIDEAGEGMPEYLWRRAMPVGADPFEYGAQRAARDEGAFSYRNARIAEVDGRTAGMVLAYRLPDPYELDRLDELPEIVRPLVLLESRAPASWYINAIACYPQFRGMGVGSALMTDSAQQARGEGAGRLSLIVASANQGAYALYCRLGYEEIARQPLVAYPGAPPGGEWILMLKTITASPAEDRR